MATVRGTIGKQPYKTVLTKRQHEIISDEPEVLGGQDIGMSPTDLLAASLVSCTCITMRMYAERKGWEVHDIKVTVQVQLDIKTGACSILKYITIIAPLGNAEKDRLFKIASACPIHKLLAQTATITSELLHEA